MSEHLWEEEAPGATEARIRGLAATELDQVAASFREDVGRIAEALRQGGEPQQMRHLSRTYFLQAELLALIAEAVRRLSKGDMERDE